MNVIDAMKIAEGVFDQYRKDQPKWWKRMDGTPILNDITVRMAQAFVPVSPVETSAPSSSDTFNVPGDGCDLPFFKPEKASVPSCGNPVMVNAERYRGCRLPSGHEGECSAQNGSEVQK